jgi:superfamily II DNA or RNA helicase
MTQRAVRLAELKKRIAALNDERTAIAAEIAALEQAQMLEMPFPNIVSLERVGQVVDRNSKTNQKISLFREMFRGRIDVFPMRWDNAKSGKSGYAPACHNEWLRGVCEKPRVKCSVCPNQAFIEVSDDLIERHLRGTTSTGTPFVMGLYPMLPDGTCYLLVADFDREDWRRDSLAYVETCDLLHVPCALERSRSGNGAHAWIFFEEPVAAAAARRLGSCIITDTMERVPDIGFRSYDRFFPSQDTMPIGGFGNLIALPLQGAARRKENSVFVDRVLAPYADQWGYLAGVQRMSRDSLDRIVEHASAGGRVLGVRLPLEEGEDEPWLRAPSRRSPQPVIAGVLPASVRIILADQIYVPRVGLPAGLVARLVRLAAFQNPEFYAAQAMRLSTYNTPRIVSCAELTEKYIALPRGCLDVVRALFEELQVRIEFADERKAGSTIDVRFIGTLREDQERAFEALGDHDTGVLAATTAFGKTVVGARMIAERGVGTLVLVHRRQLMDQWVERLSTFLDLPRAKIGTIGGGKRRPTGVVDVALIQSLVRKGEVDDIIGDYGHLVVDECHHLSAVSFELVARRTKARFVLGLSATVTRKDGHHPIIFMQCGPVRFRVDARNEAVKRPFHHRVQIRETSFQLPEQADGSLLLIQRIYNALANDEARNALIFDDVLAALEAKRSPVIITERSDHVALFAERFEKFAKNVVVLKGGQSDRQRRSLIERLASIADHEERLLIATGRYLGEGFDDPRLDTLFLAMPISWRGTLAQYAGRLHRLHDRKREVIIYDYVDPHVPMLARMAARRRAGYSSLGYGIGLNSSEHKRGLFADY